MNYGRAFTYVTEDPEWLKKVGIAMLVMLIPVIGQITVFGWSLEMMRRVIHEEPEVLPDWSEFGKYVGNGLRNWWLRLKPRVVALALAVANTMLPGVPVAAVEVHVSAVAAPPSRSMVALKQASRVAVVRYPNPLVVPPEEYAAVVVPSLRV